MGGCARGLPMWVLECIWVHGYRENRCRGLVGRLIQWVKRNLVLNEAEHARRPAIVDVQAGIR